MDSRSQEEDYQLVSQAVNGSTASFRVLIERYKDKVKTLAASVVKNETLAEDIAQEVFIKVFRNISRFKFRSKFSTWLYRITINTALTALKKQKNTVHLSSPPEEDEMSSIDTAAANATHADQKMFIHKAMNKLKTDEALVLRLFYLCEMNISEIEAITKFSQSKVRVTLHRGRKNLKTQLYNLLGPDLGNLL